MIEVRFAIWLLESGIRFEFFGMVLSTYGAAILYLLFTAQGGY